MLCVMLLQLRRSDATLSGSFPRRRQHQLLYYEYCCYVSLTHANQYYWQDTIAAWSRRTTAKTYTQPHTHTNPTTAVVGSTVGEDLPCSTVVAGVTEELWPKSGCVRNRDIVATKTTATTGHLEPELPRARYHQVAAWERR